MGGSSALGSGTSLAFPLGLLSEPATAPAPREHEAIGLGRLLEQFRRKPRINALVGGVLSGVDDIEDVLVDLRTKRLFDAEGAQLDNLGRIFRVARESRGDAAYLQVIKVWLLAYRSRGTTPDIYRMLDRLSPGAAVEYQDLDPLDPAGFRLRWTDPVLPNVPASDDDITALLVQRLLHESRAGAVRCWFFWWPRSFGSLMRLSAIGAAPSSSTGLGDVDMTTGGHMAGEVIA